MLKASLMVCDRVQDAGSGDNDPRLPAAGRAGRGSQRGGGRLGWLVGPAVGLVLSLWGPGGCAKDPEIQAVLLTKEVDAALAQQKWEVAEKKAQEIVNLPKLSDVSRDQAKLKVEQARSEQQAKLQYQKFVGYVNSEYDTAVAAYRDMPESSYYRQQARADYEKIRPSFIEDHLTRAQSALGGGRCEDVKAQLQLVLDVDPQNGKAIEIGKKPCGKK
jgi:hypothetical protein